MKGFINKAIAVACVGGGMLSLGCAGGERYRNAVDPCQFERYTSTSRQETIAAFAPQVMNGQILDQTVWNYHFESGSDKLTVGGMEKLDQIVRRRPEPDTRVFLATSRDVVYDAARADKFGDDQVKLNSRRVAAIQKYLGAQTSGRPLAFEVLVHDPADPAISAASATRATQSQRFNYVGGLTGSTGGGGAIGGSTSGGTAQQGQGQMQQGGGSPGGSGGTPPR